MNNKKQQLDVIRLKLEIALAVLRLTLLIVFVVELKREERRCAANF